jgi:hypothetical protein
MKRVLAILTTVLMLLCANAYAETADTTAAADAAIPQITFDESTAAYEGNWLTFDDDGFMLYLPSDWIDVDITDDMLAAGTYYAATSADGAYVMTVSYSEDNDVTTNDELAAQLTASGYANVTQVDLNGIDVVGYDSSDNSFTGMAFMDAEGGMYVFSFTPASDEAFTAIGQTIVSSLAPSPPIPIRRNNQSPVRGLRAKSGRPFCVRPHMVD